MREGPLEPDKNPLFSNPENIPLVYWLSLEKDYYELDFMGFSCKVFVREKKIEIKNFPIKPNFQTYLVILTYLKAKKINLSQEWVLARELKGGMHFFYRSHPLTVTRILEKIKDVKTLKKIFTKLKGQFLSFGDLSYQIELFPDVFLRYIFYEGDDEFSPMVTVNFQKGIENIFPLDVIWAMVNVVNDVILSIGEN